MSMAGRIVPGLAIAVTAFVCALPWGAGGQYRLVLPLLPFVVIHRCTERRGSAAPDWLVFLAGFAMDVVGQGPLGYWSFVYLCGYTMVRASADGDEPAFASSVSHFLLTMACITLVQWLLSSIYSLRSAEMTPHLIAAAFATMAYVLLLALLTASPLEQPRANSRLERGV